MPTSRDELEDGRLRIEILRMEDRGSVVSHQIRNTG
jgi:hypothetical protein